MNTPPNSSKSTSKEDANPLQLSSFKAPRDLTLGAGKTNKKIFTPNLNVTRNKKQQNSDAKNENKKGAEEKKWKRIKSNKNLNKTGSKVVKSSGVFSEGLGSVERASSSRPSYGRENESTSKANISKPFIKVKEVWKIDKELEDAKLSKILGDDDNNEENDQQTDDDDEAPIKLPITDLDSLKKSYILPSTIKQLSDVVVKKEKLDDDVFESEQFLESPNLERLRQPDLRPETYDSVEIVNLLRSETPKMLLLQLPDNLPGQGIENDTNSKNKQTNSDENIEEPKEDHCILSSMTEGKIGKILIYKSGTVKLQLGETYFDLTLGTQPCFLQEIMSIAVNDDDKTACMINMGPVDKKLTVIPDWEALFKDVVL